MSTSQTQSRHGGLDCAVDDFFSDRPTARRHWNIGTVSYSVRQRTPELGVRLALGAQQSQVFRLILGHGLKIIVVGLALGVAGAFALSRLIRGLLFNVTPE